MYMKTLAYRSCLRYQDSHNKTKHGLSIYKDLPTNSTSFSLNDSTWKHKGFVENFLLLSTIWKDDYLLSMPTLSFQVSFFHVPLFTQAFIPFLVLLNFVYIGFNLYMECMFETSPYFKQPGPVSSLLSIFPW